MSQIEEVREMVATMLKLTPDQIAPDTSLVSLDDSLGGTRLKLGLKRLGLSLPTDKMPITFGDLEAILFRKAGTDASIDRSEAARLEAESIPTQATIPITTSQTGVQVGIDIQDVRNLPVAADYWEHEFYAGMFANSEIAYAVAQSEPRTHLAACWCAKEALRKCDASFIKVGFDQTAVAHEQNGKPYLEWQTSSSRIRLPHALSVSHTGELAIAVVMSVSPAQPSRPRDEISQPGLAMKLPEIPAPDQSSHPTKTFVLATLLIAGPMIGFLIRHYWVVIQHFLG